MRGYNIRSQKIEGELTNKWTIQCLHAIDVYTVNDLLNCNFKQLIFSPGILNGWDEIVKLVLRTRVAEGLWER